MAGDANPLERLDRLSNEVTANALASITEEAGRRLTRPTQLAP
jgi:hypothetical protein